MTRKRRREHVGTGYIFEYYDSRIYLICGTKGCCYLSQISMPQVMKIVLLINRTCYYSNRSLWDFRMSISWENDKARHIPQIGYIEFENAGHFTHSDPADGINRKKRIFKNV